MTVCQSHQTVSPFETSRSAGFGEVSNAKPPRVILANPPNIETGAALAINRLLIGRAAKLPSRKQRGGARNCADRQSEALTDGQVANLLAATAHAQAIGLPFTRMITIHWESAGVPLTYMLDATGRYIDLLTKALARHGSATAWIYVHEGGAEKGGHCHLLIYVPAALVARLTTLQKRWLRSISGRTYKQRVIKSKPIGGRLGLETGNPNLLAVNIMAVLGYVLKGANPAAVAHFRLAVVKPGGRVIGKRCGSSQNISAKARKAKD